ncbi:MULTISPECIES: hypothetical protein [Pseudomonadaceae]|uniref:hypothetical protein n=1 Tax=Pseudomonadaceae TaxID=135621 RepID=UPI0015E3AA9F|nr:MULTISPECIES: hypothetical protein [Pseudomonadaceae]MBA1276159.1 hypothetical protein [Stutzerimonas stutzeri]MBC8648669.1 hypothetical protein [Pseudomonas sp. MT4]QXY92652.1 hypothetical protein GYM54_14175 [Pseudomonas sp. MTM4]
MDRLIELVLTSQALQLVVIGVFLLIAAMLLILFVQYNIDRAKGRHAKFLWFEVNAMPPQSAKEEKTAHHPNITGKNINTGQNYGEIGDKYTGLKQREVTQEDVQYLAQEIEKFSNRYSEKLNRSHITLGYPGCKETTNLAGQVYLVLQRMGFNKIEICTLQTFGVAGRKFGVSNAPDNSIMIEIFPADNVE